jgi:hypothetical protein
VGGLINENASGKIEKSIIVNHQNFISIPIYSKKYPRHIVLIWSVAIYHGWHNDFILAVQFSWTSGPKAPIHEGLRIDCHIGISLAINDGRRE